MIDDVWFKPSLDGADVTRVQWLGTIVRRRILGGQYRPGSWIREDVSYEVNEPDAYALEEALRQKEKNGGEVVVINERFGVRLTDVVSPAERIRRLK